MKKPSLPSALAASLLILVGGAACASGGSGGGGGSSPLSSTELSAQDLAGLEFTSVYDFLKSHSQTQIRARRGIETVIAYRRQATVYIDGREIRSPINVLQQLPLSEVESLEILRPSEASMSYGGEGRNSAVAITLRESGG